MSGLVEQKGHCHTEEKHVRVTSGVAGRERGRQREAGRSCLPVEALTKTLPSRGIWGRDGDASFSLVFLSSSGPVLSESRAGWTPDSHPLLHLL